MGVRNTMTEGKVALFDSVTMTAFGPVFDTEAEADEFVEYVADDIGMDVRALTPTQLADKYQAFVEASAV